MKTIKLDPIKPLGYLTWKGKRHEIANIDEEIVFELKKTGRDNKMRNVNAYKWVRLTIILPHPTSNKQ